MIKESVGFGGANKKPDVELIQTLLNAYIRNQTHTHLRELKIDGVCLHKTVEAIRSFQTNIRAMASPDGRIDVNGKTIKALSKFQRNQFKEPILIGADPRKLKTREEIAKAYGGISDAKIWKNANKYLSLYTIDPIIFNDPDYNCINIYNPSKNKLKEFWCHKAMHPFLDEAFKNLKSNKLLSELKEFGGCHNVRATRGTKYWSAHSWALAIDINVTENGLGVAPKLSAKFVECFKKAGFGWGGEYTRKDGMHFTIAGFDMPKGERD